LIYNAGASTCNEPFLHIAGGNADRAAHNSGPDRAKIVLGSHVAIQRLTGARR
jgi:hypothetical protein